MDFFVMLLKNSSSYKKDAINIYFTNTINIWLN